MTAPAHQRMSCMEVWGGNRLTWSDFTVPGIDLWVSCQPVGQEEHGGDVYYVSSCASGRITRMFLGDVSGHGADASPVAEQLRKIMRRNINYINQSRLVETVNEQFEEESALGRFATAVISTFFAPTRTLTVCSAGHPTPLIYRASEGSWTALHSEAENMGAQNLAIGVMGGHEFQSTSLNLAAGDMMLTYTDALWEAEHADGTPLRAAGLIKLAGPLQVTDPAQFLTELLQAIRQLNPKNLNADDTTLMLARANGKGIPMKNNLLAPFRLLSGLLQRS